MAWVNPETVTAGQVLGATRWNKDVVGNTEFLAKPPSCAVSRSTEQSVATGVWRSIAWNTEGWDTDTMWSSTAATRLDINTSGKYLIAANAGFAASTVGVARLMGFAVGGSSTASPSGVGGRVYCPPPRAGNSLNMTHTQMISLTSTQYVRIQVFQDSGGALNVIENAADGQTPRVSAIWMSS